MNHLKKLMNYPPIFLSSADSYSDIWDLFFLLFKKNWPEYDGTIYLNTQEKTIQVEGLNIVCTRVGQLGSFGKTFRAGLDQVKSESIILMMIDYFFVGKVVDKKIKEHFEFFQRENLDSLCLTFQPYPNTIQTTNKELIRVLPPAPNVMFSYQIAFWKKKMLREMALPHENPWTSEWFGSRRAEKMNIKLASIASNNNNPIPYNPAGCLHKGKWLHDAVDHLNTFNYNIDFEERGYFREQPRTIMYRLKTKWMIVKDGLKGSYWDLWKKRPVN
ncbi:MAG: hypothetical protein K0M40_10550 [Prolixibacteraceae bacterium]|nr:hypothetical protein [Prolixibacteraceae bacterium]